MNEDEENSIIEVPLESVIDAWIEIKFHELRGELNNILAQAGVTVLIDDEVELIDFKELSEFLKEEEQE